MAKIIVIANEKGGVGKTTISMNLAGSLAKKSKVLVLDADPKHIASRWASGSANLEFKVNIPVNTSHLYKEIKSYFDNYDFIIVDCPPVVESKAIESGLLVADLLIIPMIPSPLDIWASVAMQYIITKTKKINTRLVAKWLLSKHQPQTKIDKLVLELLPDLNINKFETTIHLRTAYKQSVAINSTVHQLGKKAQAAIEEIENLADEIKILLKE